MNNKYIILFLLFPILALSQGIKAQTLEEYVQQKNKEIAERQRVEKLRYDKACKEGSFISLKEYLRLYPNGRYSRDVRNRMEDYKLWSKAVSANTIASYQNYIKQSKYKSFVTQAKNKIQDLESINTWNKIKSTGTIEDINQFIVNYPKSSVLVSAKKRKHELEGVKYYNSNELINAYLEFQEAGGINELEYSNRPLFEESEEYYNYFQASNSTFQFRLENFLSKYPSSKYADEISNQLAVLKADDLTEFSSNFNYEQALKYATDEDTRKYVKSKIELSKKTYRKNRRIRNRARHKLHGNLIQIGLEFLDAGYELDKDITNLDISDLWYYNIGLSIKIGNFKDPVQFEIGCKPGVITYVESDDSHNSEFHLSFFSRLKVNLFNAGKKAKVYVCGSGYHNPIREEYIENKFAASAGLGIAWHHFDWSIYYKSDIKKYKDHRNSFISTSFAYYF